MQPNEHRPLKVVHISHTDAGAGAGRAAYRIHRGVQRLGIHSEMVVSVKRTDDPAVRIAATTRVGQWRRKLHEYAEAKLGQRLSEHSEGLFSPAQFGYYCPNRDKRIRDADILSLYWINGGFIAPEGLRGIKKPVIWRLSDVWPFTGGCHYPGACEGFVSGCGSCPQLASNSSQDLSARLVARKMHAWKDINLTIVAPSRWMANLARRSHLFRERTIEVISTGVDTNVYSPKDRMQIRNQLGIDPAAKVILFGAMNTQEKRKGFSLLRDALAMLKESGVGSLQALVFGAGRLRQEDLPIPAQFLGQLTDDATLAAAYAAADVVVVPSLEDNLPNVALEAVACGTPVVGFNVCGMPDVVRDGISGALASEVSAQGLARAIQEVLETQEMLELRARTRTFAENHFSLHRQAREYCDLYQRLIDSAG